MPKSDRYHCHNRRKYCLKVHIVLVTKYRKPLLTGNVSSSVKTIFTDIAERICDSVKECKQRSTYYLWKQFANVLKNKYWRKKILWSDGYFACSIGEVSESTIQHYIKNQG